MLWGKAEDFGKWSNDKQKQNGVFLWTNDWSSNSDEQFKAFDILKQMDDSYDIMLTPRNYWQNAHHSIKGRELK